MARKWGWVFYTPLTIPTHLHCVVCLLLPNHNTQKEILAPSSGLADLVGSPLSSHGAPQLVPYALDMLICFLPSTLPVIPVAGPLH